MLGDQRKKRKRRKDDPLVEFVGDFIAEAVRFSLRFASELKRKERELAEEEYNMDLHAEDEMAEETLRDLERAAERGDSEGAMRAYRRFRSVQDGFRHRERVPAEMLERMRQRELKAVRFLIRLRDRDRGHERARAHEEREKRERRR